MSFVSVRNFFSAVFLCILIFYPTASQALYSYAQNDVSVALGGFAGAGGWVAKNPGTGLYEEGSDKGWFGDFRLLADMHIGKNLVVKINVLENIRTTPELLYTVARQFQRDVDRSGFLYWQQHDSQNTEAAMVFDTAYVKYGNLTNELTIGRQPISTAVTFFFTPNDFFAPFSPNTFFRVYKPGVDSLRYERKLKALSQLSVIGVLGYETDYQSDSGWGDSP